MPRLEQVGAPLPIPVVVQSPSGTMTVLDDGALAHCFTGHEDLDVRGVERENPSASQPPRADRRRPRHLQWQRAGVYGTCPPVRHIDKEECPNRMTPLGKRHLRKAMHELVEYYHRERNHQGLNNEIIDSQPPAVDAGRLRRRQRLGGLLNYYCRFLGQVVEEHDPLPHRLLARR